MNAETPPAPGNERRIINGLLIACLVLGFVSLAAVYLPQHLKTMGIAERKPRVAPSALSSIVPTATQTPSAQAAPRSSNDGPLFRFVPEGDPEPPAGLAAEAMALVTRQRTAKERSPDENLSTGPADAAMPAPTPLATAISDSA